MPFISRLKKLGLLPVPALSTTLTVYSIPLEHSEETNLVYTSDSAIPADATLPADLQFNHPEGHTSPGDVLIWASRVHKKACYVHACWVFDGLRWTKPASASEIMMDHPVHSDYQLVVLSGPYVKWELKPDPDREPSLTVPDPPPLRPGARGSINTITQSVPQNSKRQQRPRSSELASDTPDGSAVLCSSSRFSTPLSDVPEDTKPNISDSAPTPGPSSVPATRVRGDSRSRSLTTPPVSGAPPTPNSSRRAAVNVLRRRRKRQRGDEDAFVPSSRRSSSSIPPAKRRRLSRERKGSSTSDVRTTRAVSERAAEWGEEPSHSEAPGSNFDKSMSGSPYPRSPRLPIILKRPQKEEGAEGVEADFDPDADAEGESDHENDLEYGGEIDKVCDGQDALWNKITSLEREKDALSVHVERMARQYPDVTMRDHAMQTEGDTIHADPSHMANGSDAEDTDSHFNPLHVRSDPLGRSHIITLSKTFLTSRKLISASQSLTHTATQTDPVLLPSRHPTHSLADTARTLGAGFAPLIQQPDPARAELAAARSELAAARMEACAAREALVKDRPSRAHAQTQTSTPTPASPATLPLISAAMQTDAASSENLLAAARAEVVTSKRAVNDITAARAADVRHFQGQHAQLVGRNRILEERNNQLEIKLAADPLRRPSETEMQASRRAANLESHLRFAQEALQLQRAKAQDAEAFQARTIAQLARELQEKEVRVRELTKMEGVDKAVGVHVNAREEEEKKERMWEDRWREKEREVEVLRAGVKMRDDALAGERGSVVRAKQETERIKEATRCDRMVIGALRDELTSSRTDLSEEIRATAERLKVQERRVAQLQQENDTCNAALAAESRTRIDLLSQLQSDAEKHAAALATEEHARTELESQLRVSAEEHAVELKRLQAELTAATDRANESDVTVVKLTQEHRIYTTSRTYLESQLRASHIAYEEHVQKFHAAQQSHEADVATMAEAHTAAFTALTETLDRERAENAALTEQHQTDLTNVAQTCLKLEKEREHLEQECKARAGLHQELEATRAELEETKQRSRQLEAQVSSANARVEEERRVVQGEVTALREEYKKVEEALRTGLEREKGRAAEAHKTFTTELCAARDKSSSLEILLATANQERVKAESLLAVEISTSSENKAILEEVRAELDKAHQELKSSQAELSTCKATFLESEQRQKALHNATSKELEESRAECERLAKDVAGFADARAKLAKLTEELSQNNQAALELRARVEQELSACKATFTESEKHQKAAHDATSKELEESRAECTRLTNEFTAVRLATGDMEASRTECARLKDELASLRTDTGDTAALQAKCVRLTEELAAASTATSGLAALQTKCERLEDELTAVRASTDDLEASRTECARLAEELAAERAASSLDPDGLRSRLAAAEAALARENATASEDSTSYWADLGSQLLRSLHEVQDQLKVEQIARQRLQDELAAERLRGTTFGAGNIAPLHNSV